MVTTFRKTVTKIVTITVTITTLTPTRGGSVFLLFL